MEGGGQQASERCDGGGGGGARFASVPFLLASRSSPKSSCTSASDTGGPQSV